MGASDDAVVPVGVDEVEAKVIVEMMEEISVCEVEYRFVKGVKMLGMQVHDLIHEYCMMEATRRVGDVERWHQNVIEGYWDLHVEESKRKKRRRSAEEGLWKGGWWSDSLIDDSYVHMNLARHLVRSGRANELESLLLDYRWMMK